MAVINMLPGGGGDKGYTIFKWLENGVLDTSVFGGLQAYHETNGRDNTATMATDGYLRLWAVSSSYGMARVYTQNYFPKNQFDYALVHIVDYSIVHNTYPIVFGGATTKNATQIPSYSTTSIGSAQSDVWFATPLTTMNSDPTEIYWGFGGSIDVKIDKVYFIKIS